VAFFLFSRAASTLALYFAGRGDNLGLGFPAYMVLTTLVFVFSFAQFAWMGWFLPACNGDCLFIGSWKTLTLLISQLARGDRCYFLLITCTLSSPHPSCFGDVWMLLFGCNRIVAHPHFMHAFFVLSVWRWLVMFLFLCWVYSVLIASPDKGLVMSHTHMSALLFPTMELFATDIVCIINIRFGSHIVVCYFNTWTSSTLSKEIELIPDASHTTTELTLHSCDIDPWRTIAV